MTVDLKSFLDAGKQPFVIVDLQIRMDAALHQNSRTTESQRFFNLFIDHVIGQHVSLGVTLNAIERTESAEFFADIGVVDIAIDDVADDIVRVNALPNAIGARCKV